MATTVSANVKDSLAVAARRMAEQENRTVSNVIEDALMVFSDLPKPLRDSLIDLRTSNAPLFHDLAHEMMAYLARARLKAALAVAAPHFADEGDNEMSDIEVLEHASRMVRR